MDPDRVIGRNGRLPWHLPEDLKFFKETTSGCAVIMGRRTYESIGRPLPGRRNFVLTRDPQWNANGIEAVQQIPKIEGAAFLIGGAEIYRAFESEIDEWLVSHVHQRYSGDTYLAAFENHFPLVEEVASFDDFTVRRYRRG